MTFEKLLAPETKNIKFSEAGMVVLNHPCLMAECLYGEWENGKCKNENHPVCSLKNRYGTA